MQAERIRTMQLLQEAARRGQAMDAMRMLAATTARGPGPDWTAAATCLEMLVRREVPLAAARPASRPGKVRRGVALPLPRPYQLSLLPNSCA